MVDDKAADDKVIEAEVNDILSDFQADELVEPAESVEPAPVVDTKDVIEEPAKPIETPTVNEATAAEDIMPGSEPASVDVSSPEPSVEPKEPAAAPVAPTELDARDEQIAKLNETITSLQGAMNEIAARLAAPQDLPKQEEHKVSFVEEEKDLDAAFGSVEGFNTLMGKVSSSIEEKVLGLAQQLALQIANNVYSQRAAADDFYRANPDLAASKPYVAIVADEIAKKNPEWDMFKIMENLGAEVRNRLHLVAPGNVEVAPSIPAPSAPDTAPAFAGKTNARPAATVTPPATKLQEEINDLIADFV